VCQPGGPGWFSPSPSRPWGLVSLDWSVAQDSWLAANRSESTCEATSIEGCRALKANGTAVRCFIYHNMELALEWLESQRAVMYDPKTADYFLQYTDGQGNKNGKIYNEAIDQGDQFFWDFTNPDAADYFVSSILKVLEDPAVDGTFTDDVSGVPEEHGQVQANINMTDAQLAALQNATQWTSQVLIEKLAAAGKWNWQAFGGQDGTAQSVGPSSCQSFLSTWCQNQSQPGQSMLFQLDPSNVNQTVAAFLIARPELAFIGYGWESGDGNWDPILLLQVGHPTGVCQQATTGVFTRTWSQGTATLDCNNWTADLPFPSL